MWGRKTHIFPLQSYHKTVESTVFHLEFLELRQMGHIALQTSVVDGSVRAQHFWMNRQALQVRILHTPDRDFDIARTLVLFRRISLVVVCIQLVETKQKKLIDRAFRRRWSVKMVDAK